MSQNNEVQGARRAQEFLELIERGRRGKLKIYIGSSAGVGKTYRMLEEAHELRAKGVDVVLGFVESHGRAETRALTEGLETIPRVEIAYRRVTLEEMDVDAILARAPAVVVVDELAHTNAPGSKNEKRFQDVLDVVRAGINVLTAVNVQHLESLNDLVTRMTGVPIRETIPDSILAQADQVVNIDLSVEDLRDRLRSGKIYPTEKIDTALQNFFSEVNLAGLRELALREVAETAQREARLPETEMTLGKSRLSAPPLSAARLMLAVSSGSTNGVALVRKGSRIAGRLNTHWYVVHVERPDKQVATLEAAELRRLADTFELAQELGAEVVRIKGKDAAKALVDFARANGVDRILIGRSRQRAWKQKLFGSIVTRLLAQAAGLDVHVLSSRGEAESEKP